MGLLEKIAAEKCFHAAKHFLKSMGNCRTVLNRGFIGLLKARDDVIFIRNDL
jgi:hypothetical protein